MKITLKVDPNACITAANCVGVAPEFFQIGDDPVVEILDGKAHMVGLEGTFEASDSQIELIEEAVDSCPTRALTLVRHT